MNFALILAILILVILVVVSIVVMFRNVNETITEKGAYVLNIDPAPCYPKGDLFNLPEIDTGCVCTVNDTQTNTYYYTKNTLEFVLSSAPVYFEEVCQSFCTAFDTSGKCLNNLQSSPYGLCLQTLAPPKGCTQASFPLARIDDTVYYATQKYAPGNPPNDPGNCQLQNICSAKD